MAKYYNEDPEYSKCSKAEFEMREKIVAIMSKYTTTFHRGYGCGSDDGMDAEDYEDAAEAIMEAFGMVDTTAP